ETDQSGGRQEDDVHFRMAEEPEQMLPEDRSATLDEIERRPEVPIEQHHDDGAAQQREREQDDTTGREHRPPENIDIHPADILTTFGDNSDDEVDRPESGRDTAQMQAQQEQIDLWVSALNRQRCVQRSAGLGGMERLEKRDLDRKSTR